MLATAAATDWIARGLEYLLVICIPSLLNQRRQNFTRKPPNTRGSLPSVV
jgi:hypothetical protein